jgi:hypothetical protein
MHHTKNKADIGVTQVIADLTSKGFVPCIPLSEHQPYDLVAVNDNGKLLKLQVKYASLMKNGCVEVKSKTVWADRNGNHIRKYRRSDFDYYAIYCPTKKVILYIPNTSNCPTYVRFEKTKNNQNMHVRWAEEYLNL